MPNHIHLILTIEQGTGAASGAPTTLGNIIRGYKSGVSKICGNSIWQRSFHDHIICNQDEYNRITKYIDNNPTKWVDDCFYVGDGIHITPLSGAETNPIS
jgi:REP element-mobilizing transposase RayT